MKKIVKQYGNATVIRLDKEDKEIFNIEEGDQLVFHITQVIKKDGRVLDTQA